MPSAALRRLATAALVLLAAAAPAAADPAPVPASVPTNVLACGATGASLSTTSATFAELTSCTIDAPTSGVLVVLGAAGTELVDGAYEAAADVTLDGGTIAGTQRWVDVGDAGSGPVRRHLSTLGAAAVLPGSHRIAFRGARSFRTATARLTLPRLVALLVPDGSGIGVCYGVTFDAQPAGEASTPASCTASAEGASQAIVLGSGVGAIADAAYEAQASVSVDGVEQVGSRRAWDAVPDGGDGTDVPFGTVARVAVADGAHSFALGYTRTSGTATGRIRNATIVALTVPGSSRLRSCTFVNVTPGLADVDFETLASCDVVATGPGSVLTTAGIALRAATASGATIRARLLDAGETDGIERVLVLPGDGTDAPWQDASLRAVGGAGSARTGFSAWNTGPGGALAYGSASLLGLFVPAPDTTAPGTGMIGGPATIVTRPTAVISLSSPDADAAGFLCSLDGAAFAACPAAAAVSGLADGTHDLRASAVDDVGNIDQTPALWSWTVDATPPEVAITSPAQDETVQLDATLHAAFACNDLLEHTCIGDVASGALLDTSSAGQHELTVRSTDAAGNARTETVRYHVLARPLTITAGDATAVWGADARPAVGARAEGLAPPDTLGSLEGLTCAVRVPSDPYPPPGTYPTRCTGASERRYDITYLDGTFTLAPPPRARGVRLTGRRLLVLPATAQRLDLPCALDADGARACAIELLARIGGRWTTLASGASAPAVVLPGDPPMAVPLPVDARLLRLARRPQGIAVIARVSAAQIGYTQPLARQIPLLLAPATTVTLPADGLFRGRGARLSAAGASSLATMRATLVGARALVCTGHTDARGPATANAALGRARATAVCAALVRGTTIAARPGTRGERQPRATNRTAAGRALNRRVVVTVRYR